MPTKEKRAGLVAMRATANNDSTDAQTPRECKSCESYEGLVHALREENEKLRGEILDLSETIVRMCKIIYGR